jgi:hypothetical protein
MIGLITMAVGTGISMYGQYQEGQDAKAMAEYNAKVAQNQAEAQAAAIQSESEYQMKESRSALADRRAEGGSRGVDYESGSPLLAEAEAATAMAFDQLALQNEKDVTLAQGANEAAMYKFEGAQARRSSLLNMAATGIKGAGNIYGAASKMDWTKPSSGTGASGAATRAAKKYYPNPKPSFLGSNIPPYMRRK